MYPVEASGLLLQTVYPKYINSKGLQMLYGAFVCIAMKMKPEYCQYEQDSFYH